MSSEKLMWSELLANFSESSVRWVKAGFPLVTEDVLNDRMETCQACDRWDKTAYAGFGRCMECKCSKIKLHWETETCPLGKWK